MRFRIVQSHGQSLDMRLPVRTMDLDLIHVRFTVPNFSRTRMTIGVDPHAKKMVAIREAKRAALNREKHGFLATATFLKRIDPS